MDSGYIGQVVGIEELKEKLLEFPAVYIYGAGILGRKLLKQILLLGGVTICNFVVTDKEGNPDRIGNYPVVSLDEISTKPEESLFLLGVSKYVEPEIIEILESKNFKNYVIPPKARKYYDDVRLYPKLEITTRIGCSVNCRYCPQKIFCSTYLNDSDVKVMNLETFKTCIDKMPQNAVITFSGFSEPFLNEECVEMMQYAASQGRAVELYTTLVGLTVEKLKRIQGIEFKTVVLHTPDDKEYANIPMTEEYFEVLDYALNMVGKNGEPWIDSANCQGIPAPEFLEFARGRVIVKSSLTDRAGNLPGEDGLKQVKNIEGSIRCSRMKELNQWVLLPDGRVVVCCMDFGMKHVLGNLETQSYEELLTGPELTLLKEGLKHQETPILCRDCTWAITDV